MRVPEEAQLARAECLEEVLKAGIPAFKIDKLRPYLERRMSISLSHSSHLTRTYVPALKLKEEKTLRSEFKGAFVGVYHTTERRARASPSPSSSAPACPASSSASAVFAFASCAAR